MRSPAEWSTREILMWVAGAGVLAVVYLFGLLWLGRLERKRAARDELEDLDRWTERITPERPSAGEEKGSPSGRGGAVPLVKRGRKTDNTKKGEGE